VATGDPKGLHWVHQCVMQGREQEALPCWVHIGDVQTGVLGMALVAADCLLPAWMRAWSRVFELFEELKKLRIDLFEFANNVKK